MTLVNLSFSLRSNFFLLFIIFSSCSDNSNWIDLKNIQVVRTSRDSTYLHDGILFSGEIKKFSENSIDIRAASNNIYSKMMEKLDNF